MNPNLESIVALHPDLVLASAINQWDTEHALEHLGIPVYGSDPQTVEGMLASTRKIADILGAGEKGAALAAQLQARLDALQTKLADRPLVHVLFVVWMDPLITIGQNTFISDALHWAGAESVVISDQKWPHLSFEEIVRVQPEYIVLTPDHQESNAEGLADLRSRAGWKDLDAVEMGHVITISADVNRPSPGMIDAIEQAARILHPEAFASDKENTSTRSDSNARPDSHARQHANETKECAACGR
jgi:ABC-type Fe3+-hydroxamate transport system substrate-binding protein